MAENMLKPEPVLSPDAGIIGIYAAAAKPLASTPNAACWLVSSAAPSRPLCFWATRFLAEGATSRDKIGTSEHARITLGHTPVTGQGYRFSLPFWGPIKDTVCVGSFPHTEHRASPARLGSLYSPGSQWDWCRADPLHLAHRATGGEREDVTARVSGMDVPATVDPGTKPVFWGVPLLGAPRVRQTQGTNRPTGSPALRGAAISAVTENLNPWLLHALPQTQSSCLTPLISLSSKHLRLSCTSGRLLSTCSSVLCKSQENGEERVDWRGV